MQTAAKKIIRFPALSALIIAAVLEASGHLDMLIDKSGLSRTAKKPLSG